MPDSDLLVLTRSIVSAYVHKNPLPAAEVPHLIRSVYGSLTGLTGDTANEVQQKKPAVPIKKSITDEYLICLEDGKKCRTLKRYLRSRFNLTPDEYRVKWGLPADYPMTSPGYSAQRSALAKEYGLGRPRTKGPRRKKA